MAGERSPKRQKTLPNTDTPSKTTQPSQIPLPETPTPNLTGSEESVGKQSQRSSWYSSWSRKAPPITQVAHDSIKSASHAATNAAAEIASTIKDVSTIPKTVRSPSLAMTLGKGRSSRGSLADATTTKVHAEVKSPRNSSRALSVASVDVQPPLELPAKAEPVAKKEPAKVEDKTKEKDLDNSSKPEDSQLQRSSWLGWLAKGDGGTQEADKSKLRDTEQIIHTNEVQSTSQPEMQEAEQPVLAQTDATQETSTSKRSWLPIWNASESSKSSVSKEDQKEPSVAAGSIPPADLSVSKIQDSTALESIPAQSEVPTTESSAPPTLPHDGTKASAWAFWSRDRQANDSSTSVDKPRQGEIAVSDTPSQNQPRRASISVPKKEELKPEPNKSEIKKPEPKKSEPKKVVATEAQVDSSSPKKIDEPPVVSQKKNDPKNEPSTIKAESSNATAVATEPTESKKSGSISSNRTANNLLLPKLHSTLKIPESPSLLLRIASMLYATKEPDLSHLYLTKDPPRIKNALAIGVHGYFPTTLIRSVIGHPTGTSIKFAEMAAKSIKRWTAAHGYECQVKTAALEGEGRIAERVDLLWKLLLNWIEEIRKSDFIMVACHSQGVPVAIMLVAKLIQFGCANASRICICAMAGVNMGPFQEYKSRWIGGSAGELFEFSDPSSRVSISYREALDTVLKFGVRVTFIGSIDDQLVSLESSIFSPLCHPHIYRAVSIDSRVHAPNFLSHLVGFALKLRNLGVQDHGLIRELSSPLAGSLYTGEGHSRIYEDDAVYDLAVSFAMETTALVDIPVLDKTVMGSGGSNNPYILPFAMRGILEEDFVKNELQSEASELLKEFDEWKPTSKVLKDVKFRLEGIRSKL